MKTRYTTPLAALLAFGLFACGDSDVEAKAAIKDGMNLENVDLSKLSPEAVKEKAGEMMETVVAKLGDVKDLASAEAVKEKVAPLLDKLATAKDAIGAKLPSADVLKSKLAELTSKFSADSKIMEVLQPVIDKIKALVQ